MATHASIYHRTTYHYDRPIRLGPHVVRLRPAPHCRTPILSYSLRVEPEEHFVNLMQDPYGNYSTRLVFPEKTTKFEVIVDLVADMTAINPFDFFLEEYAETFPFRYEDSLRLELEPYLKVTDSCDDLRDLASRFEPRSSITTNDFLVEVNQELEKLIDYNIRMEPGVQSCQETLEKHSGSCRDSAFLLTQLFRSLGIASRFVSGYLIQLTPDEKPIDGPEGPTEDFTDLHAWTEVFLPGAGWVGLDPTSGLFAGEGHIPLACTPEPSSAAPIAGALDECETTFDFDNYVTRIHEDPRVTKPYTTEEWQAIRQLGHQVDDRLVAGDTRLTMGGEPTFVSIDDMDGEEWNYTADSPFKRERAMDLLIRLQHAFTQGAIRWYGEGKWYPGESVPRWAYGCFWRKDDVPLWTHEELFADLSKDGESEIPDAERFGAAVAAKLNISDEFLLPGLEDADYYRWKASALPTDEIITETGESDSLERRILSSLHERGLEVPSGYVLPIYYDSSYGGWCGGKWEFRRGHLYLIPGSSPMGFRLPLDSLTLARPFEFVSQEFPFTREEAEPLAQDPLELVPNRRASVEDYQDYYRRNRARPRERHRPGDQDISETSQLTGAGSWNESQQSWMPRTAMCFELRAGRVHVFFPPTSRLEEYLVLLAAVEAAAKEVSLPVVLEGYEPPVDPRLERFKITPDPGVIEVNIHPSQNWEELAHRTETLYEEARNARLCAEKFMLDGRHSGSGGGNHVVLGAEYPGDSLFLRKPGLLRSLITYWQHHPGLSYLFSGLFIGPTSQAPRVDEGRDDRLFELDVAFQQLPENSLEAPWLVDRILRNLLTDLVGNTHRAEFCIDKLYSPDSSSGRLGLLELRAFEMPPHAQMSLAQSLLVRSLIARFWDEPYEHKLVRWGTSLHDRYLLPSFVWNDLREVTEELKTAGIPFALDWLRPFHEFRFPVHGRARYGPVEIELRTALEPWIVLGEEASSQGTSRYVDSSVERVQVQVRGWTEGRHVLLCNGRRIPMYPTGVQEEAVAGVRYKAWNPFSSLHPTIDAQAPLQFDLVDTWNRSSLGGCIYYVSHPGGRSYETFPVNAVEAESRRGNRFWDHGHTPGTVEVRATQSGPSRYMEAVPPRPGETNVPPEEPTPEFPVTLDLRNSPR